MKIADLLITEREAVETALHDLFPSAGEWPERFWKAMAYAVFAGGKRIRPLLVYASGECLGVPEQQLDAPAAAIELIHAFSLVHDDLPAMDDDDLRRGKPTLHREYDEATAILAADDQFGNQGIVIGRHHVARISRRIDPDVGSSGKNERLNHPGTGSKRYGILRIDPAFNGMACGHGFVLGEGECLPGGNPYLFLDQVDSEDHLGYRVFHLNACIHFHKVEAPIGIKNELNGSGALVPDRRRCLDSGFAQFFPQRSIHRR